MVAARSPTPAGLPALRPRFDAGLTFSKRPLENFARSIRRKRSGKAMQGQATTKFDATTYPIWQGVFRVAAIMTVALAMAVVAVPASANTDRDGNGVTRWVEQSLGAV